jgi:hypothetical protein
VRAVLWHQGEADHFTPIPTYQALLTNLINQSRAVTGTQVPWVVALVSYIPPNYSPNADPPLQPGQDPRDPTIRPPTIRLAQCAVAGTVPGVYLGPTSDDLGPPFRDPVYHIHFNVPGLAILGSRWAQVLLQSPLLAEQVANDRGQAGPLRGGTMLAAKCSCSGSSPTYGGSERTSRDPVVGPMDPTVIHTNVDRTEENGLAPEIKGRNYRTAGGPLLILLSGAACPARSRPGRPRPSPSTGRGSRLDGPGIVGQTRC